jgi:hypothetical protein
MGWEVRASMHGAPGSPIGVCIDVCRRPIPEFDLPVVSLKPTRHMRHREKKSRHSQQRAGKAARPAHENFGSDWRYHRQSRPLCLATPPRPHKRQAALGVLRMRTHSSTQGLRQFAPPRRINRTRPLLCSAIAHVILLPHSTSLYAIGKAPRTPIQLKVFLS